MIHKLHKSISRKSLLLITLALLGGCATGAKKNSVDSIDTRALERWNLLIAHKAEKAYDYLSPGYRATKPRQEYADEMNNRPVQWKSAKFMSKECREDVCTVSIYLEFVVKMNVALSPVNAGNAVQEKWVRVNKQWFHLPENLTTPVLNKGLR